MELFNKENGAGDEMLRKLKHDIKNQLSNIYLALDQLQYELPELTNDCLFYLDTISTSSKKIDTLLNDTK